MTPIDDKYAALGGPGGVLGPPGSSEQPTADGVGRFRNFQRGAIYWTAGTGAHEVHGAIAAKWSALGSERSVLGYPLTDESPAPDGVGRFNHFQLGSIYWTPHTGAHEVHGEIRGRWAELGWELSLLGYPETDEQSTPHGFGRFNDFQNGSIYWDPGRHAYEVWKPAPSPPTTPSEHGTWTTPPYNSGVVGVHAALLHTAAVLFFTYKEPADEHAPEAPQDHGDSALLELATGTLTRPAPAAGERNLFCAGQAFLPDGRVLVGGGERQKPGGRSLHTFTPGGRAGGRWEYLGDLADGRWYPTCVTLADGRVAIVGGLAWNETGGNPVNATYEIFDPATGLGPPRPAPFLDEVHGFASYPLVFVLPTGKLMIHAGTRTRFLDPESGNFDAVALEAAPRSDRNARTYGLEGAAVMLPLSPSSDPPYRARIMVIGGGGAPEATINTPATATCEVLDTGATDMAWQLVAPMSHPRVMPDAVLLPDGTVFVANGSSTGYADNGANPVFEAELYDPATDEWSTLAAMQTPRLYHATALLLPDGRVMTAGSDSMWNPDPHHVAQVTVEVFSPPYLHRGPRPVITGAPQVLSYGSEAEIETPDAASVTSVALLRCGSTTHSVGSDQRHIWLTVVRSSTSALTIVAPPDGNVAPPGHYMLFVLRDGIPSEAAFMRMSPGP